MMSNSYQHITVRSEQAALILTIIPERVTEFGLAEAIGRELADANDAAGSTRVIVDMGKVAFLSSVGYGPLVGLRSRVRKNGGRLVLCNMDEVVKETFDATRLLINPHSPQSLFEYAESVEDAVALLTR